MENLPPQNMNSPRQTSTPDKTSVVRDTPTEIQKAPYDEQVEISSINSYTSDCISFNETFDTCNEYHNEKYECTSAQIHFEPSKKTISMSELSLLDQMGV